MIPATGFLVTHIQADSCPAHSRSSSQLTTYYFTATVHIHGITQSLLWNLPEATK